MITQKFNIYLHAGIAFAPVVHASQYSQGETWTFTILDNDGSVYRPSSGALIGVKSDGHAIAGITGTVNADGSVSIVTTQQLTAAAGRGVFELTIDGGTNGTANFIIEVEKKPTDDAILSESDLSIIQQGINSVTPAVINETVSDYLEEHMTNPPIDPTLSISNAAADAKVTGDEITGLKNALEPIAVVESEIAFTSGYYIRTGNIGNPGTIVDLTPRTSTTTSYAIVDCSPGDQFRINLTGGNASRAWAWVTAENALISNSASGAVNAIITAPETASKLIMNNSNPDGHAYRLTGSGGFENLKAEVHKRIKYVSPTGSDSNDGDTPNSAYSTIYKALTTGAENIYIAHGEYTESVRSIYSNYLYKNVNMIADNVTLHTDGAVSFRYANVHISGLHIIIENPSSATASGILLLNCTGTITDCSVDGAPGAGCFRLDGSKITLVRCIATNGGVDGFNGHAVNGYDTECTLIDCMAYNNGDDGASIHENGKMFVHGGAYYNNVQTGLAPHDKCIFEASNVHCYNNGIGIEAVKDTLSAGETPAVGTVMGCILNDNNTYGLDVKNYTVNTLGNGYANNGSGKTRAGTGATINAYTAE